MPDLALWATSLPLAHAGHWAVWILYAVPILAVLATIAINARREDDREQGAHEDPGTEDPSDVGARAGSSRDDRSE